MDRSQGQLREVVDKILRASTFARQVEVKAWEAEITACEHTLMLDQAPSRAIASQGKLKRVRAWKLALTGHRSRSLFYVRLERESVALSAVW